MVGSFVRVTDSMPYLVVPSASDSVRCLPVGSTHVWSEEETSDARSAPHASEGGVGRPKCQISLVLNEIGYFNLETRLEEVESCQSFVLTCEPGYFSGLPAWYSVSIHYLRIYFFAATFGQHLICERKQSLSFRIR